MNRIHPMLEKVLTGNSAPPGAWTTWVEAGKPVLANTIDALETASTRVAKHLAAWPECRKEHEAKDAEIKRLQGEVDDLRYRLRMQPDFRAKAKALEAQIAELEAENQKRWVLSVLRDGRPTYVPFTERVVELESQVSAQQTTINDLRELPRRKMEEIKDLQNQITHLSKKLVESSMEKLNLSIQIGDLNTRISRSDTERADLLEKLSTERKEFAAAGFPPSERTMIWNDAIARATEAVFAKYSIGQVAAWPTVWQELCNGVIDTLRSLRK